MLTIQNIALINDIVRLPKESLQEICADINLPTDGTVTELAESIWTIISTDLERQNRALEAYRNKVLCGKTSVTWYHLSTGGSLDGARQQIINNCGFNPFEEINIPPAEQLTSTPVLISAAPGTIESEYYLRFMYRSGVSRYFYGATMQLLPKSNVRTVYVNEATGCIEVRTDAKASGKFATSLARLINQETV